MIPIILRAVCVIVLLALILGCKDSEEKETIQADEGLTKKTLDEVEADNSVDGQKSNDNQIINYKYLELDIANPWSFSVAKQKAYKDSLLIASISHDQNYLEIWALDNNRQVRSLDRKETGYHPDDVKWVDWNGDGETNELIVIVEGKKEIQLWTFSVEMLHKLATVKAEDAPQNVEIADLDRDTQLDLVVGPYSGERLTIFWGQGDFNFDTSFLDTLPIPAYPKLVDWNHDGLIDIIWSDWRAGSVQWAQNSGRREFTTQKLQEEQPGAPRQVTPGDIDNDGNDDLIVTMEVGKEARIFYNDSQGKIERIENIPAPSSGYSAAGITQYKQKTLLALSEADKVILALREKDNQWQFRQLPFKGFFPDIQFIDADEDDFEDIILADSAGDSIKIVFGPLWDIAEELKF